MVIGVVDIFAPRPARPGAWIGCPGGGLSAKREEASGMLWLILGIILLVIAIAGGAIVHPIIFALGVVAIAMFVMRARYD